MSWGVEAAGEVVGTPVAEWARVAIDGLKVAAILIGGFWALYLYRTRRRGQAIVTIQPRSRVHHDSHSGRRVLLIALRIVNSSGVLFRYERATATLMDASDRLADGGISLLPFAEQDPFLPVYGDRVDDETRVLKGELFEMRQAVVLEPMNPWTPNWHFRWLKSDQVCSPCAF